MLLHYCKKLILYALIIAFLLLILPLIPAFLIFRKYLRLSIKKERKRRLHNGIDILEAIDIGGIKQWISIRGENKENPLLLILHGGPGMSMMPFSRIFNALESHFTIVQWDQRGTGKTYRANKKAVFPKIEQMHADTLEVVNYLINHFSKEKIYILGHSWGTVLGLKLAQDYPELIYGYIGAGQLINTKNNEKVGYDNVLKIAYEKKNKKAIQELENLSAFKNNELTNATIKDFSILRKWQYQLNKMHIKKSHFANIIIFALCVPEYSLLDYFYFIHGILTCLKSKTFFDEIFNLNLGDKTNYHTSIYIFAGKKDPITPSMPVFEYFNKIDAPRKEHIWFENSGHNLFFEETNHFIKSLCAIGVKSRHVYSLKKV